MKTISAIEARKRIYAGQEIAVLDIREAGQFVEQHLLFAVPLPYSVLELKIAELVPRKNVPVLLIDDGDDVAVRAGLRLNEMGYHEVLVMQGGILGWAAAGFPVYKGVNVPSKVLGELAEEIWHPEMIRPEELKTKLETVELIGFYDVRPPGEYAKMRVPHAVCMPNGELAHRISALHDADENRPIVLTCAGRTRGIIGTIGLTVSGHSGPVAVLENGTQGWALSGQALERDNTAQPLPILDASAKEMSSARGAAMCARFDIERISPKAVEDLPNAPDASTYLFDLRTVDEARAAPLSGARVVPGVQLVQATDQYVGVRHARLVLACDTGLRSAIAAFWLRQLGFEVFVLVLDQWPDWPVWPGNEAIVGSPAVPALEPDGLLPGDVLVDVRASAAFRKSHVEGALWAIRPHIPALVSRYSGKRVILVDAADGRAQLCAVDAVAAGHSDIAVLQGGHTALIEQGRIAISTPSTPCDGEAIDFPFFVHDRHDGNLEASRRYLAWETGLVAQLDSLEHAEFKLIRP